MKNVDFFNGLKSHNSVFFLPPFIMFMGSCFLVHKSFIYKDHTAQPQSMLCVLTWVGDYFRTFEEVTIDF